MKIAINTRHLLDQKLGGIGWFTYETANRMVTNHPEHEFYFIFDRPFHKKFIFSDNITPIIAYPPARHPFLWYLWYEQSLPKVFSKIKPDIFLSNDGYLSLNAKIKQIAIIHDLNFEHYPENFNWLVKKYLLYYFPKFAHKAERIITVSEFSKNDIIDKYKIDAEKIDVAYNCFNEIYKPLTDEDKRTTKEKYTSGQDYFIYIGVLVPRKNIARLLMAFEAFKETHPNPTKLLIVGEKMFGTQDVDTIYKNHKYKTDILFTGYLPESEIELVLGSALALTYVSYFEGFGIPIVEAMNAEVPVITSNITSMPEVAGDAALLVDPFSIESISGSMFRMYNDLPLRKSLIEKGRVRKTLFSWDNTAEKIWASIEKVKLCIL
jgi:glycosyltransferase involved in cell wall biosynthesis